MSAGASAPDAALRAALVAARIWCISLGKSTLPEADQDTFTTFSRNLANDLHVHGTLEESLAMNMAAAQYQIERARAIGNNILEIGAIDHAAELPESEHNPSIRHAIGLAESYKANAKSLDLNSRYTARHSRDFLQNHTRLCQVQKERQRYQQEHKQRHNRAFAQYQQAAVTGKQASRNQEHAEAPGFVPQLPDAAPDAPQPPANTSPLTSANTLDLVKTNEETAA